MEKMKCTLCGKDISKYDAAFNHLKIDENKSADICQSCLDKIMKWQQDIYALLFPTKNSKKALERRS